MDPYIGVTGITHVGQALELLALFSKSSRRKFMCGVLGSQKTIIRGLPNKYPNMCPKREEIAAIFPDHPQSLNLIHYSTDDMTGLCTQFHTAMQHGGPRCHGFQLNMVWPPLLDLEAFCFAYPFATVVLQVKKESIARVGGSPRGVADWIRLYADFVDYVLLDPSEGRGEKFDPEWARPLLRAIRDRLPHIGLGAAGGLAPETVEELIGPLVEEFPDLSFDAQGQLRSNRDIGGGTLDLERAKAYVELGQHVVERRQ